MSDEEAAAVRGLYTSYRSLADGSLKITIVLGELEAKRFHEGFSGVNLDVWVMRRDEQVTEAG
jgi:hypothetical protein